MKKIRHLVVNIILTVTVVSTMTGCGKKTVATNTIENDNKKIIEVKSEEKKSSEEIKPAVEANKPSTTTEPVRISETATAKNTATPAKQPVQDKPAATPQKPAAAPVARGKVIVIDPGHASRSNLDKEPQAPGSSIMKIKDGGGAQGISTRTPEHEINMRVALKLKGYLEQKGYSVKMTKTDNSLSLGNVDRAKIWNDANAALAIRIHADSSDNTSVKGASMLVPTAINENTKAIYGESKRCGKIVLDSLVSEVGMRNRGVIEVDNMTGFNWSKVPVILVEMGFLSNSDEDRLLSSSDYEDKLARALSDGVAQAVK